MGGPKKEDTSLERDTARQQIALGNKLADQSQTRLDTQTAYEQPLVSFLQGIIGGDTASKIRTAQIPITQLSKGSAQARENILDTQPAGAARDFALAGLKRDQASQTSGFLNDAYLKAFPMLAQIGTGDAQIGLQELGGGLRATEGGAQGISSVNQRAANQKSSTLGLIGGLASTAGNIATGGISGAIQKSLRPAVSGSVGDIPGGVSAAWPGGPLSTTGY